MRGRPAIKINTGDRFGRLVVLKRHGYYHGGYGYLCRCDCGKEKVAEASFLKRGLIKSCGCWNHRWRVRKKPVELLFTIKRLQARTRKIDFNLSLDEFCQIIGKPCHYCGGKPQASKHPRVIGFLCNGIDRIRNSESYNPKNSVSCCAVCNWAKTNLSAREFLKHVHKIWEHSASKSVINTGV